MKSTTRFYEKQNEAIRRAQQLCYIEHNGPFAPHWGHDPDNMLAKAAEETAMRVRDEYDPRGEAVTDRVFNQYLIEVIEQVQLETFSKERFFGEAFLYYPDFAANFQSLIGTEDPWIIRHFLEEFFSLESPHKPKQLDDWEDYEYLADVLRASLANTTHEDSTYKKASLQNGVDWLLEKVAQLRPARAEQLPVAGLKWQGSKAELAELGYSLLEAGLLKVKEGERGAALTALGRFFGMDLGKPESHLQTIQKRKDGVSPTPLLDRLRTAFVAFLKR